VPARGEHGVREGREINSLSCQWMTLFLLSRPFVRCVPYHEPPRARAGVLVGRLNLGHVPAREHDRLCR